MLVEEVQVQLEVKVQRLQPVDGHRTAASNSKSGRARVNVGLTTASLIS